jgi:hypothetical protein
LALNQEFTFETPSDIQLRKVTPQTSEKDWTISHLVDVSQFTPVGTIFVPSDQPDPSAVYQFRLVVHFPTFDYRSVECTVRTVTQEETRASHFVVQNSTSTSLDVAWSQPSVSDGLVGYRLTLSLVAPGNGRYFDDAPKWEADRWTIQQTVYVPFGVSSYSLGCGALGDDCLAADTVYRVELVHVRQFRTTESSIFLFSATAKAIIVRDSAELCLHGATLSVSTAIPHLVTYDLETDIKETFLDPCFILSSNGAVNLTLSSSTVLSLSSTSVRIRLSEADYGELANQVYLATTMTPLTLLYAGGQPIAIEHKCRWYMCPNSY